ncbi:MAG: DUF1329 domain-containing protein [Deltaproteobacteria bacterium]|nr:DUF1329 domain-containing protein [Deltaproteobacteria bacterium]
MKYLLSIIALCAALLIGPITAGAGPIVSNDWKPDELTKYKQPFDDPSPIFTKTNHYQKLLKKETWDALIHDQEKAKVAWNKMRGFSNDEVVGKVAPEITPGKYTLADKKRLGFDKLMPDVFYDRFNEPGGQGQNLLGNFTEFQVIPPRQVYGALSLAEATMKYDGKAKLGPDGYMLPGQLYNGFAFARPSGPQAGWQIVYNSLAEQPNYYDSGASIIWFIGVDKDFKKDTDGLTRYYQLKLCRRVKQAPLGLWYNKKAEKRDERWVSFVENLAPRDQYGTRYVLTKYNHPKKLNNMLYYTPLLRRIRKYSSTDTQDQYPGLDQTYDDINGLDQKLNPKVFPYEVKLLGEREVLIPFVTTTGAPYLDTKSGGYPWRSVQLERRMVYEVEMKQLDSTYVYSKRMVYVDKETLQFLYYKCYDQKGNLWRTFHLYYSWVPDTGSFTYYQDFQHDLIDEHSTFNISYDWPAEDANRSEYGPKRLMRSVK